MAASTTTLPLPGPAPQIRGLAAAAPSELSQAPLLGILAVVMGAGIATLAGRLISLGLADLKGSVGISFDQGAWISTAFNVAQVFIGPFTVYLGALLGPRRVLLWAAGAFTIVSAYLPFVHNYGLLITLLAIAGLTSGTFYPLTLTFALRSIPLRYLAYTVAFYATLVEGAVNFAPSLYGFYRQHWSWPWMFWTCAVLTPVMMFCTYYGIPRSPSPPKSGKVPSFAGFLYLSAGLGLIFAALDQGQRLDWWRSGEFTALFAAGVFFLLCALVRRLRGPNPLVDMPYLRQWNTVLLGAMLFMFRFILLSTILIVPQSLALRGLDASQYGPAVLGTAVAQLFVTFIVALLLNKGADTRLLMAAGFACVAFACLLNAELTSSWAAENYFRSELLVAAGQSFAFVGLVATIILQALFSGGPQAPQRALTFSAFFHTVRLFGGQVGVVLMTHFIAVREQFHSNMLGLHVQKGSWITDGGVHSLATGLFPQSSGIAAASGRAIGVVSSRVRLQAYTLTYIDGFYLIAFACVLALLVIALIRGFPLNYGDLGASQQVSQQDGKK